MEGFVPGVMRRGQSRDLAPYSVERNLEQGWSLEARITGQAGGSELGAQDVVSGTPRGGAQEDLGMGYRFWAFETRTVKSILKIGNAQREANSVSKPDSELLPLRVIYSAVGCTNLPVITTHWLICLPQTAFTDVLSSREPAFLMPRTHGPHRLFFVRSCSVVGCNHPGGTQKSNTEQGKQHDTHWLRGRSSHAAETGPELRPSAPKRPQEQRACPKHPIRCVYSALSLDAQYLFTKKASSILWNRPFWLTDTYLKISMKAVLQWICKWTPSLKNAPFGDLMLSNLAG